MRRRRPALIVIENLSGVSEHMGAIPTTIEGAVPCSVKHGKRGDIPRGPTTSHSHTGLCQRPLELLPEGLRRASIAVGREAAYRNNS